MVLRITLHSLFVFAILLCAQMFPIMVVTAFDGIWEWGLPNMEKWAQSSLVMALFGFLSLFLIFPLLGYVEEQSDAG